MDKLILKKIRARSGFSTLEMLIAMALVMIALSAVIVVTFGNQTITVDSQMNAEAINKAQELLEQEQAFARKDFRLVNPVAQHVDPSDPLFKAQVDVVTQSDFLTKNVTATLSWTGYPNRSQHTTLSSLVTNFNNAAGGDTCDSAIQSTENWASPVIANATTDFGSIIGDTVNTYPITDVDAYHGKLYVTVGNTTNATDPNFFVLSIANPATPTLIPNAKVDANPNAATGGLNAVAVAIGNTSSFAYAASAYRADFSTCANGGGTNTSCGQFQVIDLSTTPPTVRYSFKVPNATGLAGQAIGNSIFYLNGYIYLGLTRTATGPEFHIIDVHNPLAPSEVGYWPSSGSLGADINSIYVKDGYAYIAHPASATFNEQITVLNVANPASPARVSGFYSNGASGGNGKSVDLVGNTLFLGRTASNLVGPADGVPEMFMLDATNPASIPSPELGASGLSSSGDSVNEVFTRSFLTFAATNNALRIWRTDTPASISTYGTIALPVSGSPTVEPSFDCEGNYFYTSSNSAANKGALSVITSN